MAQRVLIQGGASAAISVSLPGFDVTTANLDQMAFDSRWSGHQFYRSGTVDSNNDGNVSYSFGETLPTMPLMVSYVDPAIVGAPGAQLLSLQSYRNFTTGDYWFYAVVTTSSVQFRFNYGNQFGRLYFALFKRVAG